MKGWAIIKRANKRGDRQYVVKYRLRPGVWLQHRIPARMKVANREEAEAYAREFIPAALAEQRFREHVAPAIIPSVLPHMGDIEDMIEDAARRGATEAVAGLYALATKGSPQLIRLAVWAERSGVSVGTARHWIARGMPVLRRGRVLLVDVPAADAWLRGGSRASA